jgi:hypothetical protein
MFRQQPRRRCSNLLRCGAYVGRGPKTQRRCQDADMQGKKAKSKKNILSPQPIRVRLTNEKSKCAGESRVGQRRVFPRRHLELNGGAFAGSRNQNCPDIFTERRDEHQLIAWMWHQPHGCLRNTSCGLDVGSHVGMTDAASIVLHLLGLAIRLLWLNLRSGHLEPLNF